MGYTVYILCIHFDSYKTFLYIIYNNYFMIILCYVYTKVGETSYQHIMDSIPAKSDLGLDYKTVPVGFGNIHTGFYIRVVATEENTWVIVPSRAERLKKGQYLEEKFENVQQMAKVYIVLF